MKKGSMPKKPITYLHNDVFKPDSDLRFNACVGKNGGPYDYNAYSLGYFKAGKQLILSVCEDQSFIDVLIYPLVYVHRQAIELGLKHLAVQLPLLLNEKPNAALTHKLEDNWKVVAGCISRIPELSPGDEQLARISEILADFVEIDPSGEAFRYPESRSGKLFCKKRPGSMSGCSGK